jgi:uncharacterized membrane-anchored protein YitT (DUF2179 family)
MHSNKPQPLFLNLSHFIWNLILILVGSMLCAVSVNGILIPQHFVTGGVIGISLVVHKLIPFLNVGLIYVILNIPLFCLAWMAVGRRFFYYSIMGSLALSLSIVLIHVHITLDNKMLYALLAGIITGTGAGITLRSLGSQGGLDILSVLLLKRYSISIGNTILAVNGTILVLVTIFYSLEAVLYTLVVIYVSAKVLNIVVSGLSQRKAVFIISSNWKEISNEILTEIQRGVTVIQGEGGYTGKEEHILYTVVTFREVGQLKRLIQRVDPNSFVVVSNTMEVMDYRIGNQPHW